MNSGGRYLLGGLLTVVAVVWTRVNGPVEGPTLITLTPSHGLTVADLPSVAALLVAAWLLGTAHRHRAAEDARKPRRGRDGGSPRP